MSTMTGESKEHLITECIKWYPAQDRPEWARWYRGWTRSALRTQAAKIENHFTTKKAGV